MTVERPDLEKSGNFACWLLCLGLSDGVSDLSPTGSFNELDDVAFIDVILVFERAE
jgi:hypothetical protein